MADKKNPTPQDQDQIFDQPDHKSGSKRVHQESTEEIGIVPQDRPDIMISADIQKEAKDLITDTKEDKDVQDLIEDFNKSTNLHGFLEVYFQYHFRSPYNKQKAIVFMKAFFEIFETRGEELGKLPKEVIGKVLQIAIITREEKYIKLVLESNKHFESIARKPERLKRLLKTITIYEEDLEKFSELMCPPADSTQEPIFQDQNSVDIIIGISINEQLFNNIINVDTKIWQNLRNVSGDNKNFFNTILQKFIEKPESFERLLSTIQIKNDFFNILKEEFSEDNYSTQFEKFLDTLSVFEFRKIEEFKDSPETLRTEIKNFWQKNN
jgi:hypothetical protein